MVFEEYVDCVTINDADPRIESFWVLATEKPERLMSFIRTVPLSVDEWRRQRGIYERSNTRRRFELGCAVFYLNRTTRSGIIHNGGPIGGFDQKGNYKIDARFNRDELERRVLRIGLYSERIRVSGIDGLELLSSLELDPERARSTFVYLDPPYYAKGNELYFNRFRHEDHAALAHFLSEKRGFRWLMTYDDVPQIRELYSRQQTLSFTLSYSAYKRRQGAELLIHPAEVSIEGALAQAPLGVRPPSMVTAPLRRA